MTVSTLVGVARELSASCRMEAARPAARPRSATPSTRRRELRFMALGAMVANANVASQCRSNSPASCWDFAPKTPENAGYSGQFRLGHLRLERHQGGATGAAGVAALWPYLQVPSRYRSNADVTATPPLVVYP